MNLTTCSKCRAQVTIIQIVFGSGIIESNLKSFFFIDLEYHAECLTGLVGIGADVRERPRVGPYIGATTGVKKSKGWWITSFEFDTILQYAKAVEVAQRYTDLQKASIDPCSHTDMETEWRR